MVSLLNYKAVNEDLQQGQQGQQGQQQSLALTQQHLLHRRLASMTLLNQQVRTNPAEVQAVGAGAGANLARVSEQSDHEANSQSAHQESIDNGNESRRANNAQVASSRALTRHQQQAASATTETKRAGAQKQQAKAKFNGASAHAAREPPLTGADHQPSRSAVALAETAEATAAAAAADSKELAAARLPGPMSFGAQQQQQQESAFVAMQAQQKQPASLGIVAKGAGVGDSGGGGGGASASPAQPRHDTSFTVTWRNLRFCIEPKWHEKLAQRSSLSTLSQRLGAKRAAARSTVDDHLERATGSGACSAATHETRVVLDQLDGSFKSGELTAILGPSGAGKTTLLDCLTGHRKSGLSGSVRFSARSGASVVAPAQASSGKQYSHNCSCSRCCSVAKQALPQQASTKASNNTGGSHLMLDDLGLLKHEHASNVGPRSGQPTMATNGDNLKVSIIPQNDHLIGHLTVYETLSYASKMKNCFEKHFNHKLNIKRVAQQLGLMSCLGTRINKLSGGQYKRVSIAQELLSSPDILILDEPTSGLDAMTCYQTVQVLRRLTDERSASSTFASHRHGSVSGGGGETTDDEELQVADKPMAWPQQQQQQVASKPIAVILTIHQPNSDVFQQFNHVYVVAQGGKCIYEGPPASIESVINRIGLHLPNSYYNPATMIVEIAAGKFGQDSIAKLNAIQKKQYAKSIGPSCSANRAGGGGDEHNSTGDSAVDCPTSSAASCSSFASSSSPHDSDEESGGMALTGEYQTARDGGLINKGFSADEALESALSPSVVLLGENNLTETAKSEGARNNNKSNASFAAAQEQSAGADTDCCCGQRATSEVVDRRSVVLFVSSPSSASNTNNTRSNADEDRSASYDPKVMGHQSGGADSDERDDHGLANTKSGADEKEEEQEEEGEQGEQDKGGKAYENRSRRRRRKARRRAITSVALSAMPAACVDSDAPSLSLSSGINTASRQQAASVATTIQIGLVCGTDTTASPDDGGGGEGGGSPGGGGGGSSSGSSGGADARRAEKRLKLNSLKADQKFPFWRHTYLHFHRSWLSIVRDPMLCSMQLALHIIVPVMVSLVYGTRVGQPNACPRAGPVDIMAFALEPNDTALQLQEDLRTTLENIGYIFFKLYGIIFAAMTVTVLTFPLDMHVLVKEFRNGWYGLSSYFLGRTLADIPFQLTLPLLAMSLSYYATGQPYSHLQWRFLSITAILILSSLIAQSQGLLFGAILMDRMKAAVFVAPAATTPIILFAGFLVRTQSIPHYLRPLSNLSYLRYAIEACLISRYGFNQCECDPAIFNQTVPEMPPIARSMLDYWLSSFKPASSGAVSLDTPALADNSTLASALETTTMAEASEQQATTNPDLFTKLIDSLARANSFGRNITSCEQVVPYPMMDYDLKDSQLAHCFAILLAMLIFTRFLTFLIVCVKVKRKV